MLAKDKPCLTDATESEKVRAIACRCGGRPGPLMAVAGARDRWQIRCQVSVCQAINTGQGQDDVIRGWNRLSTHLYR